MSNLPPCHENRVEPPLSPKEEVESCATPDSPDYKAGWPECLILQ